METQISPSTPLTFGERNPSNDLALHPLRLHRGRHDVGDADMKPAWLKSQTSRRLANGTILIKRVMYLDRPTSPVGPLCQSLAVSSIDFDALEGTHAWIDSTFNHETMWAKYDDEPLA
jgi:hypothetical protein